MATYLFPFGAIKPGEKIIIYGCGDVGQQFLAQIKQTSYCYVLFAVDRLAEDYENWPIKVLHPDEVEWEELEYDHLLIALHDDATAAAVRRDMLVAGANENKILRAGEDALPSYLSANEDYERIFGNTRELKKLLSAYCACEEKRADMLWPSVIYLRECGTADIVRRLKEVLLDKAFLTTEEKATLLQRLDLADVFDGDLVKLMLDIATMMPRWQDGYAMLHRLALMISLSLSAHKELRYPEYYHDFRRAAVQIFDKSGLTMYPKTGTLVEKPIRRIAFCIPLLSSIRYSIGAVLPLMNELCERGYEVALFDFDSDFFDEDETKAYIWQPLGQKGIHEDDGSYAMYQRERNCYSKGISVHCMYKLPLQNKAEYYLDQMAQFGPDVVVYYTDDRFLLSYVIAKYYPSVFMSMRGAQTAIFAHAYITGNKQYCMEMNRIFNSIPEEKIVERVGSGVPFLKYLKNKSYKRKEFGLNEEDFVVVTVGLRLDVELSPRFVASVANMLRRTRRIKWLLVYSGDIGDVVRNHKDLLEQGRIILRGWEEDLPALYKICDACLNPERMGGGVSLRLAMLEGLPIVTGEWSSDVTVHLHSENRIKGGYDDLMHYIERLAGDPVLYARQSKLMKELMEERRSGSFERFIEILQETHDTFCLQQTKGIV